MPHITVGVDTVEISRMGQAMAREHFLARIFSPEEQDYIAKKHTPAQTAAGHFAAKEAFLKAMGTGITSLDLGAIGITHNALGAPIFALTGWAAELSKGCALSLSITHAGGIATAFVVAYQEDER